MTESELKEGKVFKVREPKAPQHYVQDLVFPEYPKGSTVVLFDGDILAFKVSSVCEWKYRFTHKQDQDEEYRSKSIKEFKATLDEITSEITEQLLELKPDSDEAKALQESLLFWDYDNFIREDIKEAEPFSYCLKTMKASYKGVMKALDADYSEMYIGGDENYRLDIPSPNQYKTSVRDANDRPIHLTESKVALCGKFFGGKKIKGIEADDILQMRQYQLHMQGVNVIMYSNDKDRLQGWYGKYYNPDNHEVMELTSHLGEITESKKGCGLHWLLYQMSQGDPVDGYSPKEWYSKEVYKRGYGQKSYYLDFYDAVDEKELLERWIEVHSTRLLTKPLYEWTAFDGRKVKANWLGIMEMMYSFAYMRLYIDDDTSFTSLCTSFGVDVGVDCIFEVSEVETEEE